VIPPSRNCTVTAEAEDDGARAAPAAGDSSQTRGGSGGLSKENARGGAGTEGPSVGAPGGGSEEVEDDDEDGAMTDLVSRIRQGLHLRRQVSSAWRPTHPPWPYRSGPHPMLCLTAPTSSRADIGGALVGGF
jgi:hypothetical protein